MRIMPFRTAREAAVHISEPQMVVHGELFGPRDPVRTWDYLTRSDVLVEFEVNTAEVLADTGLPSLDLIAATVQVDSVKTGFRKVVTRNLTSGTTVTVRVEIPADSAAQDVEVRCGLTLTQELSGNEDAIAYRKGSRLYWQEARVSFELEGEGGGFPVEAFDFGAVGWPSEAAWRLNFDAGDLQRPFLAAARLFVNSRHARAAEILTGKSEPFRSIVFHGVLQEMLTIVAAQDFDAGTQFEEGSVGAVLEELTNMFLGLTLFDTSSRLRNNRSEMLTRIQSACGFLGR